ncbi:MAG: MFS transporter [Nitrososphaeria archaeon]
MQDTYIMLALLWISCFWPYFCQQTMIALMPEIQESLSLSTSAAGVLLSLNSLGYVAGFQLGSLLCTKLGRVKTIVFSTTVLIFSIFILSIFKAYLILAVVQIMIGVSCGIYPPAGLSLLSDLFSSNNRGKFVGIHETSVPTAMTVGPVFVGLLLNFGFDWGTVFQFCIVPSFALLGAQIAFFKIRYTSFTFNGNQNEQVKLKLFSQIPLFLIILVIVYVFRGAINAEVSLLPIYWVFELGADVGFSAFILGIMRIFSIFGQVCAGYLSDVFGRFRIFLAIQILLALSLVPTSYLPFGLPLYVSYAIFSVLYNAFMPVMFTIISEQSSPEERPKNISIVMSIGGISTIISTTILSTVAENYSFKVAWIYPIITSFASIPLIMLLKNNLRKNL